MKDISIPSTPPQSKPIVRWLVLACWVLVASLYFVLFMFDVVRDYANILIVCEGQLGMFGGCSDQLAISALLGAILSAHRHRHGHFAL